MSEKTLMCLVVVFFGSFMGHGQTLNNTDVLHYSVTLEPDIAEKYVKGSVFIRVRTTSNVVEFNCGDLIVDSVAEKGTPLSSPFRTINCVFRSARDEVRGKLKSNTMAAMEEARGKSLKEFFAKWVYLQPRS